jgi:hypothetical protein
LAERRKRTEPGISRIDQPARRTYGWFVRVSAHGIVLAKFFPDQSCGGKVKAFAAARKHRDLVRSTLLGRSKSKITGAAPKRIESVRDPGWQVDILGKSRFFKDSKYGSAGAARAIAIQFRNAVIVHGSAPAAK